MLATIKFHDLAHYVGDFANSPTCSHVGTSPILLLHMPLKLLMDFCVILFLIIIATLKLPSFSSCFLFFQDLHALLVFGYFFSLRVLYILFLFTNSRHSSSSHIIFSRAFSFSICRPSDSSCFNSHYFLRQFSIS